MKLTSFINLICDTVESKQCGLLLSSTLQYRPFPLGGKLKIVRGIFLSTY